MNKDNKMEVVYPYDLFNSLKRLPINNVFPCSVLFNENLIGGLLFTCSSTDLKFLNINNSNLPQPDLKFRMINSKQRIFLIEFHLLFDSNKTLILHLNPVHPNVKMLFKLLITHKSISFHFYCKQTNIIASTYTKLEDEEMDWIIRNNMLISSIGLNKGYLQLAYYMTDKIENNDRLFQFNDGKSVEQSFIGINQEVIKFLN